MKQKIFINIKLFRGLLQLIINENWETWSLRFFKACLELYVSRIMPVSMLLLLYKPSSVHDMLDVSHDLLVPWICQPLTYLELHRSSTCSQRAHNTTEFWHQDRSNMNATPQLDIQNFYDSMSRCVRALIQLHDILILDVIFVLLSWIFVGSFVTL